MEAQRRLEFLDPVSGGVKKEVSSFSAFRTKQQLQGLSETNSREFDQV
jgi:hypothetical protein